MDRRARLIKALEEAERELEAARKLPALNAAAKKLRRARTELKALEDGPAEQPKRRAITRGCGRASS
jgi:hypothetical protein